MKYILGFLFGVMVAIAATSWAECCGGFNVPFDTQLAIEREQAWAEQPRRSAPRYSPIPDRRVPCERER